MGEPRSSEIAAVVLAAGMSRRYGQDNKLLAELAGEPLLRRVVCAALASKARPVIVVTGHEAEPVRQALTGLPVRFVHNDRYDRGMGTSVAAAARVLAAEVGVTGTMVLLGDMPAVDAMLLDALIDAYGAAGGGRIVFPVDTQGRQRNPVLWPRSLFAELSKLDGDKGGRDLIQQHAALQLPVRTLNEDAISQDIDTPEALAAWRDKR